VTAEKSVLSIVRALRPVLQSALQTIAFVFSVLPVVAASPEGPREWIDPATRHRVVRLSTEPGSTSFYFHQNAYTPGGDKLLISTPRGLATVNLTNRAIELVVPRAGYAMSGSSGVEIGRKSRQVYYSVRGETGSVIRATHLDTKVTRDLVKLPFFAVFNGINADETVVVGTINERGSFVQPSAASDNGGNDVDRVNRSETNRRSFAARANVPRKMKFYAANIKTGEIQFFNPSTNWLNHVQCSPSDPSLMLYCHEGPWHEVDRVWTLRIGSDTPRLMHRRTMPYEIAGHEFFGHDGEWVWYDLQTPRSKEFWLAGVNVKTSERVRYALERAEWSVHYNVSPDGKLFAGDGGGPDSVANKTPMPENKRMSPPANGQWIYLFHPSSNFTTNIVANEPMRFGRFVSEKLVDLSKHDYRLEPNLTFTPDGKWIVFRSNMEGERHVYAVEVAKEGR
jgi:oligogalacturonide lyase